MTRDAPQVRVVLGGYDLSRATFRRQPTLSADAVLRSAVAGASTLLPEQTRLELLTALGPKGRAAYRVLTGAGKHICMGVTLADVPLERKWWLDYADDLAQADIARLRAGLDIAFDEDGLRPWHRVLDKPSQWFEALASGVRRTGPTLDEIWRHSRYRLDAEEGRFDVSMQALSGLRAFMNTTTSPLTMSDGQMSTPWLADVELTFSADLVVAPQLSPTGSHVVPDRAGNLYVGYSLGRPTRPAGSDQLTALLGPARAALLLALDRSRSMGTLATRLGYAPSTVTHHADKLVASGLVTSVREGRLVMLQRTYAGNVLVETLQT